MTSRTTTPSRPITILRQTLAELLEIYPHVAAHIRSLGYVGMVTLVSGVPAAQCYERPDGRADYVAGSRALADRYNREMGR